MADTVVFTSRRAQRAQRMQAGRHALVGFTLALAGVQAYSDGHGTWPDAVGIVGGTLLLVTFIRELRAASAPSHGDTHAHHGIGWVDVFAGLVTAVEAWHLHHQGKVGLPIAYGFVAVLLTGLGLAHPWLLRLRRLIVSDEGFDIRTAPWRRVRAAWSDVAAVQAEGLRVEVSMLNGRVERFDLSDAPEGARVVEVFAARAAQALAAANAAPVEALPPAATAVDPVATDE